MRSAPSGPAVPVLSSPGEFLMHQDSPCWSHSQSFSSGTVSQRNPAKLEPTHPAPWNTLAQYARIPDEIGHPRQVDMSVDQQPPPISLGTIVQLPAAPVWSSRIFDAGIQRCLLAVKHVADLADPAAADLPFITMTGSAPGRSRAVKNRPSLPDRRDACNGCISDGSRRPARAGSVSGGQPDMPRFHEHARRLFSPASPRRERIVARMGRNRIGGFDERSEQSRAEGPRPNATSGEDRPVPGSTAHIHHWNESVTSSRFTELVGRRFQRKRDSGHG